MSWNIFFFLKFESPIVLFDLFDFCWKYESIVKKRHSSSKILVEEKSKNQPLQTSQKKIATRHFWSKLKFPGFVRNLLFILIGRRMSIEWNEVSLIFVPNVLEVLQQGNSMTLTKLFQKQSHSLMSISLCSISLWITGCTSKVCWGIILSLIIGGFSRLSTVISSLLDIKVLSRSW